MMPKACASFGSEISVTAPIDWYGAVVHRCKAMVHQCNGMVHHWCTNHGDGKFGRRTALTPAAVIHLTHNSIVKRSLGNIRLRIRSLALQRTYDP